MEAIFEIKPIGVKYVCDKCQVGEMEYTRNYDLNSISTQYEHQCDNCGNISWLENQYPIIKYQKI